MNELEFEAPAEAPAQSEPVAEVQALPVEAAPEAPVEPDPLAALDADMQKYVTTGKTMVIIDTATNVAASELLLAMARYKKDVTAKLSPFVEQAQKVEQAAKVGVAAAKAEIAKYVNPVVEVEGILKRGIAVFQEAERKRLALLRDQEQQASQQKADEDKVHRANALAAVGLNDAAERVMNTTVSAPVVRVKPAEAPKVSGVYSVTRWKAEVLDIIELCKAVAEGKVPAMYVIANQTALNQLAIATKESFAIPGVRAVAESNTAVRT